MSALGEKTLCQHLIDVDSLAVLAAEGLPIECIPTEELRPIFTFAMNYFFESGRTRAPSIEALTEEFGPTLEDNEIEWVDPSDSIEWVLDDLKGSHAHYEVQQYLRRAATAMAEAPTMGDKLEALDNVTTDAVTLQARLASRYERFDQRLGGATQDYEERAASRDQFYGMRLGLEAIDTFTFGIHPGELAVIAAGPKVGKSYFADRVALREWEAGKTVVLFTLENSIEMTRDRIACMAQGVSARAWQQGKCDPEEVERIRKWEEQIAEVENPLWILQPGPGKRGIETLVREAQMLDAESLLIDQLTFVEVPERDAQRGRPEQVRNIMHTLKAMISTGRDKMPVLLAHQITREGLKAAAKSGYLEMYHLAESSEVERTADWVFSLYQTHDDKVAKEAKLQTLASRRADMKHFRLTWDVDQGAISVLEEWKMPTA